MSTGEPNPIYLHLTRNRRWPSARAAAVIWAVLTIGCMVAYYTGVFEYHVNSLDWITPSIVIVMSILLCGLSPVFSGMVTAISTSRIAHDDPYQLLKLTGLSRKTIITGHLLASLFRLRLLWCVCFGLLPTLFFALVGFVNINDAPANGWPLSADEAIREYGGDMAFVVIAGGVLGTSMNWLSICVSLWSGVKHQKPEMSVGIALGVALVEWIGFAVTLYSALGFAIQTISLWWFPLHIVVLALIFLVIGLLFLNSAEEAA